MQTAYRILVEYTEGDRLVVKLGSGKYNFKIKQ